MKKIANLLLLIIGFSSSIFAQLGKVAISPQIMYEDNNSYFAHDYFVEKEFTKSLDYALKHEHKDGLYSIENKFDDGYSGHYILIKLNSELEIMHVEYDEWKEFDDPSDTRHQVENIILSTNQLPRKVENLIGHYTLLIKTVSKSADTRYHTFNGKFRFYSENGKQKGKDWIHSQNEVKLGIKDDLGVYIHPDENAVFKTGNTELEKLLRKYSVQRTETNFLRKGFVLVTMIVNEDGTVDPNSLIIFDDMQSRRILNLLKQDESLMTNWIPAKYNGENVKSEVNVSIRVYQ